MPLAAGLVLEARDHRRRDCCRRARPGQPGCSPRRRRRGDSSRRSSSAWRSRSSAWCSARWLPRAQAGVSGGSPLARLLFAVYVAADGVRLAVSARGLARRTAFRPSPTWPWPGRATSSASTSSANVFGLRAATGFCAWPRCSRAGAACAALALALAQRRGAVARPGSGAELSAGAHPLERSMCCATSAARRSARLPACASRPGCSAAARCSACAPRRSCPAPRSTSAWCCSRCGCSSSSIRRRCSSARGDLRDLFGPHEGRGRAPEFFVLIEALAPRPTSCGVRCCLSSLAMPGKPVRIMIAGAGRRPRWWCARRPMRSLMRAELLLAWLTPGAQLGLLAGIVAAAAAVALPRTARLVLAAMLLLGSDGAGESRAAQSVSRRLAEGLAARAISSTSTALRASSPRRGRSSRWAISCSSPPGAAASRKVKITLHVVLRETRLLLLQPARRRPHLLQRQRRDARCATTPSSA